MGVPESDTVFVPVGFEFLDAELAHIAPECGRKPPPFYAGFSESRSRIFDQIGRVINRFTVLKPLAKLSRDGNTLTIKSTRFHTDGSVKAKESRYTRTSGSTGFVGGWKDVNPLDGSALIEQISAGSRAVHFSYPEREIHADASLDGTDAAFQGPVASPGGTIAVTKRDPRQFELTNKMHGRVVSVGYWRISGDGRSLTESYWVPGRSNDRLVRVYDKQ